MIKDLEKNIEKVRHVLKLHPKTRSNDKLLWLGVCVSFYDLKAVLGAEAYSRLRHWLLEKNVPMFESLSRCRRKLQENDKTLLPEGFEKARGEQAEAVREWSKS